MPLAKEVLERLIEASPDIVIATDAQGTISYYNDGARDNLGYSREEIIGRAVQVLYPSLDEARRVMRAMRGTDRGGPGRLESFPTTFVAKDGTEIPVAISGIVIRDENGEEDGTIGFSEDLSEFIRKDKLAILGEVAIGLSHEIGNPLTAIANYVSLIERFVFAHESSKGAADELRHVAAIREEVRRIEIRLARLREMAEKEDYRSTSYLDGQDMLDLSAQRGPLAGRRLLVVDDDDAVRNSIVETLNAEGCRVDECCNGREALGRLRNDAYDLVLSDVVMPEMDGYELLLETRRLRPETKVVLMTAFYHDQNHVLKRSRLQGLEGVLFKKPVDPERLRKTLGGLLTRAPSAP